jgi:hypothetical protein
VSLPKRYGASPPVDRSCSGAEGSRPSATPFSKNALAAAPKPGAARRHMIVFVFSSTAALSAAFDCD